MSRAIDVPLNQIRIDGGTQSRAEADHDVIREYAEAYKADEPMPPLKIVDDGESKWLFGGHHRYGGALLAGLTEVPCEVIKGTLEDARWLSLAENKTHGLRRTPGDKRKVVESALLHPKSKGLSDAILADHCGVDRSYVTKIRGKSPSDSHEVTSDSHESSQRIGKDGKTYNTANIGKKAEEQTPVVTIAPTPVPMPTTAATTSAPSPAKVDWPDPHTETLKYVLFADARGHRAGEIATAVGRDVADVKRMLETRRDVPEETPEEEEGLLSFGSEPEAEPTAETAKVGVSSTPKAAPVTKPNPGKKAEAKPVEMKDSVGNVIPDRLRDVFADPWLAETIATLKRWHEGINTTPLLSGARTRYAHLPYLRLQQFIEQIQDFEYQLNLAIETARQAVPYAVCQACGGDNCDQCRHSGYLAQWRWEEVQGGRA